MLKEGIYAVYKGKQYLLSVKSSSFFQLISNDKSDIENGFILKEDGTYRKRVKKSELDTAFVVKSYCSYKSNKFQIVGQKQNRLLLYTSNSQIAETLTFDFKEPGVYHKWVSIEDTEQCWVEKNPRFGFTNYGID